MQNFVWKKVGPLPQVKIQCQGEHEAWPTISSVNALMNRIAQNSRLRG